MSSIASVGAHGRDITSAETAEMAPPPPSATAPTTFHDVLEAINPLQYLPVIGTIYRVATGEQGSSTLQTGASLVSGLLMGGPVGLLTSMAGTLAEHYFHLEHLARSLIVGDKPASPAAPAPAPAPAAAQAAAGTGGAATPVAAGTTAPPTGPAGMAAVGLATGPAAGPMAATPHFTATVTAPAPASLPQQLPAAAPPTPAPSPTADVQRAAQATAAYAKVAELPARFVPGGREG